MYKIREVAFVTLFFILFDIVLCLLLYPLITRVLSDFQALIIVLILDFLIISIAYVLILNEYKLISVVSGALCFVMALTFLSCLYYLSPLGNNGKYLLNELLAKVLFREPLGVISLYSLLYSVYKLLLSGDFKKRTTAIVFEILIIMVLILSTAIYDQYMEKEKCARNSIWSFIDLVDETIYKINSNEYYNVHREVNFLASSFRHNIYNVYSINYPDSQLVFEELEDYIEGHQSKNDISKILIYLSEFQDDLRMFIGQNAIITDRKISEFFKDKTDEFNTTVLK